MTLTLYFSPKQIDDYPAMLREVARVLRPGGLFLSGEWLRDVTMADGSQIQVHAPNIHRLMTTVWAILANRGIHHRSENISGYIRQNGRFGSPSIAQYPVVVNSNRFDHDSNQFSVANMIKDAMIAFSHGMKPLLLGVGFERSYVNNLVVQFEREVREVQGLKVVYVTVWARRLG